MDRAIARRNVVLSRMLSEDISLRRSTIRARSEPSKREIITPEIARSAPCLSEMVRGK